MRFVFILSFLLLGLWATALEARGQIIDLTISPKKSETPQIRKSQNSRLLKTTPDFRVHTLTTGLGDISALAFHAEDYTLFTADKSSGRIWKLTDRNGDGRIDMKSALAHRFDTPTGLAISGKDLYVSDRNAVWHIQDNQPPVILAGLRKANSIGDPHPLSISSAGDKLYLGLTTQAREVKILTVDTQSGEAGLLDQLKTEQTLRGFVALNQGLPWIFVDNAIGPNLSSLSEFNTAYKFRGVAIPPTALTEGDENKWPRQYARHIFASLDSPDGFSVVAIPAAFGKPRNQAETLLTGFVSSTKLTAWGTPTLLLFTHKGLIVADPINGDIYQLSKAAKAVTSNQTTVTAETTSEPEETTSPSTNPPTMRVSTITGSQIESASTLNRASGLDVGSTIIRDFKPLTLDKENESDDGSSESEKTQPPN